MSSMLSSLSQWFVNPRRNPLARLHMQAISSRLRKYGLRYDDLYDPKHDLDIKEALERLPREVVDARHQRLKRAMDLSMKHQYLTDDLQTYPLALSPQNSRSIRHGKARQGGGGSMVANHLQRLFTPVLPHGSQTPVLSRLAFFSSNARKGAAEEENEKGGNAGMRKEEEEEKEGDAGERWEEGEDEGGEYMNKATGEIGGPRGPEPTRYGDWERGGRCSDF